MSLIIKVPVTPNLEQTMAIVDAWLEAADRGYLLTWEKVEK